jgi:hypothetical protein
VVYCCAVADHHRAQQALDSTSQVIRGAKGGAVRSPFNLIKAENAVIIRTLARQLWPKQTPALDEGDAAAPRFRNSAAVERTITALRSAERVVDADAAAVALARHVARALDQIDPARYPAQTASLARVHLQTLRHLRGDEEHDGGGVDELIALLSAPVGDTAQP